MWRFFYIDQSFFMCISSYEFKMHVVARKFLRHCPGCNFLFPTWPNLVLKELKITLCQKTLKYKCFSTETSPSYLEYSPSFDHRVVHDGMKVISSFVTEEEEATLLHDIEPKWRRLKYQEGHWDNAIQGYRETEGISWSDRSNTIITRIKSTAFSACDAQKSLVHVLDLSASGFIKPHVDSVKFCGRIIAGLSLLSPCVMKFSKESDPNVWFKALLDRRSLYIMQDSVRYDFTHEVLKNEDSLFNGKPVTKGRRISVLCRSEPRLDKVTDNIFKPIVIPLE